MVNEILSRAGLRNSITVKSVEPKEDEVLDFNSRAETQ